MYVFSVSVQFYETAILAFICINPGFFVGNNRELYYWKNPVFLC